jgi:omega-6 fatty acid desaturase (delta-12 desaturase)
MNPTNPGRAPVSLFTPQERQSYAQRGLVLPLLLFLGVASGYAGLEVALLASPVWLAVPLSILTGLAIAMLFVVGHDAAHNSFTRLRWLNQVIGRLAFLPALHAFSLWDLTHNRVHHMANNLRGVDRGWEPMSPADYRSSSPFQKALYRLYRTPLGTALYYLPELWAQRLVVPLPWIIGPTRPIYWFDTAFVLVGLAGQIAGAIAIGGAFGHDPWFSLLTGVAVPFLIWNMAMSVTVFLHHTHPAIPWYATKAARDASSPAIQGTVRVAFPKPFYLLTLNVMEHNGHHLASGVPLYRLKRLQTEIEARARSVAWDFSLRAYRRICRRCQLYDYDRECWVTFDGVA